MPHRPLLFVLGFAAFVLLCVGALPTGGVDAQVVATDTPLPTATATPGFTWLIKDTATPAKQIWVDPFGKRFHIEGPNITPLSTAAPKMRYTRSRVVWTWNDQSRQVFVSGNVDRVRQIVRLTYWRRPPPGTRGTPVVSQISAQPQATVLALPLPPEPAITIEDFRFVPNRLTIGQLKPVTFVNYSAGPHELYFDRSPGMICTVPSNLASCTDFTTSVSPLIPPPGNPFYITPGRQSLPYPRAQVTPDPADDKKPTPTPITLWRSGTYTYFCRVVSGMTGSITVS